MVQRVCSSFIHSDSLLWLWKVKWGYVDGRALRSGDSFVVCPVGVKNPWASSDVSLLLLRRLSVSPTRLYQDGKRGELRQRNVTDAIVAVAIVRLWLLKGR